MNTYTFSARPGAGRLRRLLGGLLALVSLMTGPTAFCQTLDGQSAVSLNP